MSLKDSNKFKDTEAAVRLRDPASGGVVELWLTLDPEREVILDARYRLTDMPEESLDTEVITNLIKGKGFLFCLTLVEDELTKSREDSRGGKRNKATVSLTALKLALSEYIMRRYAIDTGIAKSRGEFIEKFLEGHPMYDIFKDIEFS